MHFNNLKNKYMPIFSFNRIHIGIIGTNFASGENTD